jgi:hypothetical protein
MAVCLRAAWRYVKHLQNTIEALKREIIRNLRVTNTAKLSRAPAHASPSPSKSWHAKRQEHRTHHKGFNAIALSVRSPRTIDLFNRPNLDDAVAVQRVEPDCLGVDDDFTQ